MTENHAFVCVYFFSRCILATDMAKHHEILKNFKSVTSMFDFSVKEHKDLVSASS